MKNRTLVNKVLLKGILDTPYGQCQLILDDDLPIEQKLQQVAGLLLRVQKEAVADLVCATIVGYPTATTAFVRWFVKTFNDTVSGKELPAESELVYAVLEGLLRAEFGLDLDRAHPGVTVTPSNILELAAMGGAPILAMPARFSGGFSNQLATYLIPTVACDTLERARFASAVGACLVAVGDSAACHRRLDTGYLFGQVAFEMGVKSKYLFSANQTHLWLAHVGVGLSLMADSLGVSAEAKAQARFQTKWVHPSHLP